MLARQQRQNLSPRSFHERQGLRPPRQKRRRRSERGSLPRHAGDYDGRPGDDDTGDNNYRIDRFDDAVHDDELDDHDDGVANDIDGVVLGDNLRDNWLEHGDVLDPHASDDVGG